MRGALALAVGSTVFVVPDMSKTILLLPLAIVGSIFLLGIYGVLDSAIVYVTSFFVDPVIPKIALRLQGMAGVPIGFAILLYGSRLAEFQYVLYQNCIPGTLHFSSRIYRRAAYSRPSQVGLELHGICNCLRLCACLPGGRICHGGDIHISRHDVAHLRIPLHLWPGRIRYCGTNALHHGGRQGTGEDTEKINPPAGRPVISVTDSDAKRA